MEWLHPTYAWALLAVPAALLLYGWGVRQRRRAFDRFGDASFVQRLAAVFPRRRIAKAALVGVGLALVAVSLMGPRVGTDLRTVERRGVDLVIALDVSQSMEAEDVAPNRLERAKNEIRDLVESLQGDRAGLVLFAGDGFVQCPLTTDYGALHLFLDAAAPDQVPVPGTDVGAALDAATRAFDTARPPADSTAPPGEERTKVLLLVSDGENHEADLEAVKKRAADAGVSLFAAGIGSQDGARIPVYENGRQVGVKRDRQGQIVETRLNEEALRHLAEGGAYFRIGGASSALSDVPAALRQLDTSTYAEEQFEEYTEMYQWPLAAGLLLLLIEPLIHVRRRAQQTVQTAISPELLGDPGRGR